jgi:hypothetical protein
MLTSTSSAAQHVVVQDMAMVAATQHSTRWRRVLGAEDGVMCVRQSLPTLHWPLYSRNRDVCQAESAYAPLATLQEESNVISLEHLQPLKVSRPKSDTI